MPQAAVRIDADSLIGRSGVCTLPFGSTPRPLSPAVAIPPENNATVRKTGRAFIGFSFRRSVRGRGAAVCAGHTFDTIAFRFIIRREEIANGQR
jgi:hypothetical protein